MGPKLQDDLNKQMWLDTRFGFSKSLAALDASPYVGFEEFSLGKVGIVQGQSIWGQNNDLRDNFPAIAGSGGRTLARLHQPCICGRAGGWQSEPPRDCRRPIYLSYAAMGKLSMAV